jgi:uncharacterized membrane protein YbhN (UPF0104 family)
VTKKHALFALGLVVAGLFLWFALDDVDFAELGRSLGAARKSSIPLFLAVLFAFYWTKALRWHFLLAPLKSIPTRQLFPPLMVGYGVSMLVPMHLGEIARILIVRSEHALRASALVMSIALERMLDLVTIPLLFAVAMITHDDLPPTLIAAGYLMGLIGLAGIATIAAFVLIPDAVIGSVAAVLRPLPPAWRTAVTTQLRAGAEGASALRTPARLAAIGLLTLLQWALMWLCAWIAIWSVGIDISWAAGLLTVALINVAVALPTSPGYVGSVQAAFVLALLPYAVEREAAIAASIYFHVLVYIAVVGAGVVFLHRAGRSLRSLRQADPFADNA